MTWNHRIIEHEDSGKWYGLHEVFYDEAGQPENYAEDPIVIGNDLEDFKGAVNIMVRDIMKHRLFGGALPILDESVFECEEGQDDRPPLAERLKTSMEQGIAGDVKISEVLLPETVTNNPKLAADLLAAGDTIRAGRVRYNRNLGTTIALALAVFLIGAMLGAWLTVEVING